MSDKAIEHQWVDAEEAWKRVAQVRVSVERVDEIRQEVVRDLRKSVKRPGFRKGKVPLELIRREYAGEIERETLERVVPMAWRDVLDANPGIEPLGEPRVSNLKLQEEEPLGFDLEIQVVPEIELKGLEDLVVQRVELVVDDRRVEEALAELAERNAQWVPVERGAQPGDALTIEYVPLDEEKKPRDDERNPGYQLELGAEGVLPEFNAALEGLEPGEDTQVEVNYPEDYPREDLAGKTMTFQVKVLELKEKRIPPLDDDFAQGVGPFKTIADLRERVREDLEQAAHRESDRQFRSALIEEILKVNAVAVPPSLEARYVQAMIEDLKHSSQRQFDDETLAKLAESYAPSARAATQRWLVLDHVKKSQGIEATEEELDAKIEEIAREQGRSREETRQALELGDHLERLKLEIEEDRVFSWLADQVQVEVVERAAEEEDSAETSASSSAAEAETA